MGEMSSLNKIDALICFIASASSHQQNDDEKTNAAATTNQTEEIVKLTAPELANLRTLKIQSGALKRYTKEVRYYQTEVTQMRAALNELKAASDSTKTHKLKIKQARQALQETEGATNSIMPKLKTAWNTVDGLMAELEDVKMSDEKHIQLLSDSKQYLTDAKPLTSA